MDFLLFKLGKFDCAVIKDFDLVLHPMFLENPHWETPLDYNKDQARDSKTRLLEKAAREKQLLCAFHFPFPCLGYVRPRNNHWIWEPVNPESLAR